MRYDHAMMSPYERAESWLKTEYAIMSGVLEPPNEFENYVPVEARRESEKNRRRGRLMRVTKRHLKVWAALAEIMGVYEFTEPLGWGEVDIRTHLLCGAASDEK